MNLFNQRKNFKKDLSYRKFISFCNCSNGHYIFINLCENNRIFSISVGALASTFITIINNDFVVNRINELRNFNVILNPIYSIVLSNNFYEFSLKTKIINLYDM